MKSLDAIFALVPDCHAETGHYAPLWERHFYEGLRDVTRTLVTPDAVDFNWARSDVDLSRKVSDQRASTSQRLWDQIQTSHQRHGLDAVISYCFASDIDPALVTGTIQMGIPWINFYCDSTHRFPDVEALARIVSLNWFPEHAAILRYRALGVPFLCQPYAVNPKHLPDLSCQSPRYPATFIGLPVVNRITQLGFLRLLGCPVAIRGYGWVESSANPFRNSSRKSTDWLKVFTQPGLGEKISRRVLWPLVRRQAAGPLSESEFMDHLRQSEIVLGLNQARDERGRLASYLMFRDIEFPGYGCCYLTVDNEDLASAFEIGQEVLAFHHVWEAARQMRKLRRQTERIRQIGMAGRRRVLSSHTWKVRLKQLAERL